MNVVDRHTIGALRKGSHEAFERVFAVWFGSVKAFIFSYVNSAADAEELAEEIFVNLWERRASLDPSRSFSSYLHTVARNAALNFLRQKLVRSGGVAVGATGAAGATGLSGLSGLAGLAAGDDIEQALIAHETAMLIDAMVERMPAQRREIYRLSRGEGLKNDEIAARLGTTKRNVESQLSLTLRTLKKKF
jgi:RNA polymerase sigma-70 factor (ECF subfamily)